MKNYLIMCVAAGLVSHGSAIAQTSDQLAIEDAYHAWAEVTNAKDIERWVTFLTPDALFLPPDHEALGTYDAIRQYYLELFEDPHFTIKCEQISVEIAESGDIAWSTGKCSATFSDANSEKTHVDSKWAKVWARQADGGWKCRLNIWNSDPS